MSVRILGYRFDFEIGPWRLRAELALDHAAALAQPTNDEWSLESLKR